MRNVILCTINPAEFTQLTIAQPTINTFHYQFPPLQTAMNANAMDKVSVFL